ncbi:MAG: hypothetical protein RLZ98_2227 [Pseudomonadota bacterium]|jgi:aminocarboxymuconate-semialdehyde decarboxylase
MRQHLRIVDFHSHHVPAGVETTAARTALPSQKARWEKTAKLVSDEELLLAAIDKGDIDARVVSTPPGHVAADSGEASADTLERLNDGLRSLVERHPGRVFALATIDVYAGERAAREVERAAALGFKGIFAECAKGTKLIDAPEARPALAAAAERGMVVFVHPMNPQPLFAQMEPYGRKGTLFARGTVNAQALIALLEGGVFQQLPGLRIVVTALAFGGLAMAANFPQHSRLGDDMLTVLRNHVVIDTMGFSSALIGAAADILGPANVVTGSDWPIVDDGLIREKLQNALSEAGLSPDERQLIAGDNALRLLGIG